jgi:hypothetical protein
MKRASRHGENVSAMDGADDARLRVDLPSSMMKSVQSCLYRLRHLSCRMNSDYEADALWHLNRFLLQGLKFDIVAASVWQTGTSSGSDAGYKKKVALKGSISFDRHRLLVLKFLPAR